MTTGWGEFEVQIKVFFQDVSEKFVTFYHVLKLFHTQPGDEGAQTSAVVVQGKKTVVSEFYDEIVFQDPSPNLHALLTTTRPLTLSAYKHTTDFDERRSKHLKAVVEARSRVQDEIGEMKDKVKAAKEAILQFRSEIAKSQGDVFTNEDSSFLL